MSEDHSLSPDDIQAIVAEALPITGTGTCYLAGAPTTAVPVIAVDAANRPDVLDLGRVVRLEPLGPIHATMSLATFFRRPEGFVVVTVTFTSPVSCSLKLIFHLPQHSQLVQAFVGAPQVVISPSPIDAEGNFDASRGIAITCTDPQGVVRHAVDLVNSWGGHPCG
jgi:hypothetical protein